MSRDASIVLPFAASDYMFRLAISQWQKLEEAVDCGPIILIDRLYNGQWKVKDVRETIRWGLIGGGMSPAKAADMIRDFVDAVPLIENLLVAQRIARAGWVGAEEEDEAEAKKNDGDGATASASASTISKTVNSDGASSTGSAAPSASIPAASTN